MKIVLDTNVLVSGLLNPQGNPAQVVTLALAGSLQVCHDKRILAEYEEVLARPRFKFDPKRTRDILAKLTLDGCSVQTGSETLGLPDTKDEPFLAVALASFADYLVTGNLVHFPPDKRHGRSVISPSEFMQIWRQAHPDQPAPMQ